MVPFLIILSRPNPKVNLDFIKVTILIIQHNSKYGTI